MAKCDGSCWKGRYCFAGDLLWKRTCQEMIAHQFIGKKKQDLFDAACNSVLEVKTLHFTDSGFGCQMSFKLFIYLGFGVVSIQSRLEMFANPIFDTALKNTL